MALRPLHYYCVATGTWFAAFGVQGVMFAWLVTMVLQETPQMVGIAQMAMLVPVMLLMLLGGALADVLGGRRVAILAQAFAVLPGAALLAVLVWGTLDFATMLIYAVAMGCAAAFVTPARDGLLNQVAEGRIQRTVILVTLTQFGVQMLGFVIAGFADSVGPEAVLAFQTAALAIGVLAYLRLPATALVGFAMPSPAQLAGSVIEGSRTVLRSPAMRAVVVQNIAMGLFFMGSFIVTMPLLVREEYAGSAADLAMVMAVNSLGLVASIVTLFLRGGMRRQGRALLAANALGCFFLAAAGFAANLWTVALCVFFWGACGGVAMSMARTIMQECAPDSQRARVMAFFSFAFMGAGPVGALLCGYLVAWLGAGAALIAASCGVFVVSAAFAYSSRLWNLCSGEPLDTRARRRSANGRAERT